MLPTIPSKTLSENPAFASLYNHLTTRLLDPADGSTRATSRPNDALDQELRTHRAELAKTQLLQKELEALTSRATGLSEELQETLDLLTSPYYRSLSDADKALLFDEFEELEDSLPVIGQHLSTSLQKSTLEVARIAYPTESPRVLEQKVDSLPAETAHRFVTLQKARTDLSRKQATFTHLCCDILEEYREITVRLLELLSQKSDGVVKTLTAQTEHLALVSESMFLKLCVLKQQALAAIYDPEAINALENYQAHLRDTKTRLVARQRVVEEELRKYESAGSDMRGLVERYSQVMQNVDAVTKDIKRLVGKA